LGEDEGLEDETCNNLRDCQRTYRAMSADFVSRRRYVGSHIRQEQLFYAHSFLK